MIRLAFEPENHLISLVNQVKAENAAASNTPSASPFIPIANPNGPNPFAQSSLIIIVPTNGFMSPSSYPRKINADGRQCPRKLCAEGSVSAEKKHGMLNFFFFYLSRWIVDPTTGKQCVG